MEEKLRKFEFTETEMVVLRQALGYLSEDIKRASYVTGEEINEACLEEMYNEVFEK